MAEWLASNWGSILVVLILAAVVLLIVHSLRKDRKAGKRSCGGSCSGCSGCAACSPKGKKCPGRTETK